VARDPNYYSDDDPTQYINYGGGYGEPPGPPVEPWYRKPAALVASGALGTVLIALVVYGLVKLVSSDASSDTTTTPSTTPTTTTAAPVIAPPTGTVTETVTVPTTTPPGG
jgi:hypothetical protein